MPLLFFQRHASFDAAAIDAAMPRRRAMLLRD